MNITRRNALVGLFAIITSQKCPAIVRSMVGNRSNIVDNIIDYNGSTAKLYIQNGLVAMWDGIENAGWGVHDASAATWKDLSGNNLDFSLVSGNYSWLDNAILGASRNSGRIGNLSVSTLGDVGFIEFVGNPYYGVGNGVELATGIILEGNVGAGVMAVRIRGYASRKVCQILAGTANAPWYNHGYLTKSEDRPVYCAGAMSNQGVGDVYYAGQSIEPYLFSENWNASPLVCLGAYRTNDERYAYKGSINAIRVYSRALTTAEIAANYAIDKMRFGL